MRTTTLDDIVSLCKRRGFVYQSADIYGGLNGVYDFGHLGALTKQNIRNAWKKSICQDGNEILFMEGSLLAPEAVWVASGHVENFHDPMVDCLNCKKRYRADDIDLDKACPNCGKKEWTDVRQFNMMFKTQLGASAQHSSAAYLRPETAQSIFINFKNAISTNRVKLPFGIAQIGKAFRNEITPKQFLFRMREFEQMEMEWFCKPGDAPKFFEYWTRAREQFYYNLGVNKDRIRLRQHGPEERSHYSSGTSDVEYEFPFGFKELEGIADRGTFDLDQHAQHSGKELGLHDEATSATYRPHVIECSVGTDRLFLTLMFDAYCEEELDGDTRTVLKLHPTISPIKAAILPLSKKLSEPARTLWQEVRDQTGLEIEFDESGSIGKRYRRQDEIGTPVCFTYDFDSESDGAVTARSRDTMEQKRIPIGQVATYLQTEIMGQQ